MINGVIPVRVVEPGKFEFTLRRWPADLNVPIRSKPKRAVAEFQFFNPKNVPARYRALDIRSARLKIGGFDQTKPVSRKMAAAKFTVELNVGEADIETWFRTAGDKTLGAYYLSVRRVD